MLKQKTKRRLNRAIDTVADLKLYLERAVRKLNEDGGPDDEESLRLLPWLNEHAEFWRRKRDAESKSSESYRFFDGKSEGFQSVIRHIEELNGLTPRGIGDRGYISARGSSDHEIPMHNTASMNLQDTVAEQTFEVDQR